MSGNRVVCFCNDVDYATIRKAMINGARTLEEVQEMTGASTVCGSCAEEIEKILASVCGCNDVSLEDVVNAVKDGADTVEKVQQATNAGTTCGRCNALIENIITLRK